MKIDDILVESYSDAKRIFSQDEDRTIVEDYLTTFKELTKRNIISGTERDIGTWIKAGWEEFKAFVDSKKDVKTRSSIKKAKKSDSLVIHEDDNKMVVIPLSETASCFYGRKTKWCTSATHSQNQFNKYFANGAILYYILLNNGTKYAATHFTEEFELDGLIHFKDEVQFRNDQDKIVKPEVDGISEKTIHMWTTQYRDKIESGRKKLYAEAADKIWESGDAMKLVRYLADTGYSNPKYEDLLSQDAFASLWYAMDILKGAFPKGEDAIATEPRASVQYASKVLQAPFPLGEDAISQSPYDSLEYAMEVLDGPFPKGEQSIAQDGELATIYATEVLKKPFPEGEAQIMNDLSHASKYAVMLKDRGYNDRAKKFGVKATNHLGFKK